jgi:hypothetical protein
MTESIQTNDLGDSSRDTGMFNAQETAPDYQAITTEGMETNPKAPFNTAKRQGSTTISEPMSIPIG